MKKFNELPLRTLIGIHNYSIIVGIFLILVGLFTMPTGIATLLIGFFLVGIGIYANKMINQKQGQEIQQVREERKNSIEYTYRHESLSRHNLPFKNNTGVQVDAPLSFKNQAVEVPYIKKYRTDVSEAKRRVKQLEESYAMVRKTTDVATFFRRLHFCFNCTLDLMGYKIKFTKNATPEVQYIQLKKDLREIVDDFIVRSYNNEIEKCASLKTEKAKKNRMDKYFEKMYNAFENADSFWSGNSGFMHYSGALYVPENIDHLKRLHEKHTPIDIS